MWMRYDPHTILAQAPELLDGITIVKMLLSSATLRPCVPHTNSIFCLVKYSSLLLIEGA